MVFFYFVSLFLAMLIFSDWKSRRKGYWWMFTGLVLAEVLFWWLDQTGFFANWAYFPNDMVVYSIAALALGIFLMLAYEESIQRKLLFFILAHYIRITGRSLMHICEPTISLWWEMILLLCIYVPIYFLSGRHIAKDKAYQPGPVRLAFLYGIGILLFHGAYMETYLQRGYEYWYFYFSVLEGAICLFVVWGEYADYRRNRQLWKTQTEMELQKERVQQYAIARELMEEMNTKSHNLKHQVRDLTAEGRLDVQVAESLQSTIEEYEAFVQTGNEMLDTILTQKSIACKNKGIAFTCILDGQVFQKFSSEELQVLFGNLFDNAFEAMEELPQEKRYLKIRGVSQGSMCKVTIRNPYEGTRVFEQKGLPVSGKKDGTKLHGYGTKSIKRIIERQGGKVSFSASAGIFSVELFLF